MLTSATRRWFRHSPDTCAKYYPCRLLATVSAQRTLCACADHRPPPTAADDSGAAEGAARRATEHPGIVFRWIGHSPSPSKHSLSTMFPKNCPTKFRGGVHQIPGIGSAIPVMIQPVSRFGPGGYPLHSGHPYRLWACGGLRISATGAGGVYLPRSASLDCIRPQKTATARPGALLTPLAPMAGTLRKPAA
jgi:hypothetical protein